MSEVAYIGLGSNLGDGIGYFEAAVQRLAERGIHVQGRSSLYTSAPLGPVFDQPDFVNAVVRVEVASTSPMELLTHCLEVERSLGRTRHEPQGPRTIDLDLLLMGDRCLDGADLQLPHPRLLERAFVLLPLAELEPNLVHPATHQLIVSAIADVGDQICERQPLPW